MHTNCVEIKSQNTVIGEATYPVYEFLEEAIDSIDNALEILNRHVKATAMNRERRRLIERS